MAKRKGKSDTCRLCLQTKDLRFSHIIPEFAYKECYGIKDHRFYAVSSDPDVKTKIEQKGYREYLFCDECEGRLSKYEHYASSIFRISASISKISERFLLAEDIDYLKFKLFQISILWRSAICEHSYFKNVSLNPKHSEEIREAILNEQDIEIYRFGCMMIYSPSAGEFLSSTLIEPVEAPRVEGHRAFKFGMLGFWWAFIVSSHTEKFLHHKAVFLRKDGFLPIVIEDKLSMGYLQHEIFKPEFIEKLKGLKP